MAASFDAATFVTPLIGFFAGLIKGSIGIGDGIIFLVGWNIAFLVFKVFQEEDGGGDSDGNESENPFSSYDLIVGIIGISQTAQLTFLAYLNQEQYKEMLWKSDSDPIQAESSTSQQNSTVTDTVTVEQKNHKMSKSQDGSENDTSVKSTSNSTSADKQEPVTQNKAKTIGPFNLLPLLFFLPMTIFSPIGSWSYRRLDVKLLRQILAHLFYWFIWIAFAIGRRLDLYYYGKKSPASPGTDHDGEVQILTAKDKPIVNLANTTSNSNTDNSESPGTDMNLQAVSPKDINVNVNDVQKEGEHNAPDSEVPVEPQPETVIVATAIESDESVNKVEQEENGPHLENDINNADQNLNKDISPLTPLSPIPTSEDNSIKKTNANGPSKSLALQLHQIPLYVYYLIFFSGISGGFLFGLLGAGGPPYILCTLLINPNHFPKDIARLLFPFGQTLEVWIRHFSTYRLIDFESRWATYGLTGITALCGNLIGTRIASKIDPQLFHTLLAIILITSSLLVLGIFRLEPIAVVMFFLAGLCISDRQWKKVFGRVRQGVTLRKEG